ncbi:hypothetical protein ISF_04962 [Cordyceps fumosorosea ARSEF 2679]|uniref:Uncharacterized protein n=1 Tax=Cordyceps fumosorosea (strain ARSEF 2679) TaxID=1081104 RepID=A0A167VXF8_CORFA|nr:hypothetical protein ISF_04962 [Cordyceps fumosorosea ARSEF 2679]OAA63086.1 hypothetical protein ISF_04962 [Cordyceps fumosorosea ARSEF 2679]
MTRPKAIDRHAAQIHNRHRLAAATLVSAKGLPVAVDLVACAEPLPLLPGGGARTSAAARRKDSRPCRYVRSLPSSTSIAMNGPPPAPRASAPFRDRAVPRRARVEQHALESVRGGGVDGHDGVHGDVAVEQPRVRVQIAVHARAVAQRLQQLRDGLEVDDRDHARSRGDQVVEWVLLDEGNLLFG